MLEKAFALGLGESSASLGDIGCDGHGCSFELVGRKAVTAGKAFCKGTKAISGIDGLLMDIQLLKREGRARDPRGK